MGCGLPFASFYSYWMRGSRVSLVVIVVEVVPHSGGGVAGVALVVEVVPHSGWEVAGVALMVERERVTSVFIVSRVKNLFVFKFEWFREFP
jgi:hypothetical protein